MFKLQRLEITGFKSFADYTEIIFTGNGITAVVGPNGCGKSNCSEAISWVLGEQRAKSLRGSEMKDVIFQGTGKRKPSGMAEVVLHLVCDESLLAQEDDDELFKIDEALKEIDEHSGNFVENETAEDAKEEAVVLETSENAAVGMAVAPAKIPAKRHWRPRKRNLDFAHGEAVSVTRRLYLSGESEYLLNGKTCRLRDIQDLFSGTGLSGAHYAIIEQGRIGQILSAKPHDRRALIEEAAGISKFRTRQRAAEARLESAKNNLRRLFDIITEIEKQVNSLRRQAGKTKRYKILREDFRQSLRQLFVAEGKHLSVLTEKLQTDLEEAVKKEQNLLEEITSKDEAFRLTTQKARQAEENLTEIRAKQAENALQRDRNLREVNYQEEQLQSSQSRLAVLVNEINHLLQRQQLTLNELKNLESEEKSQRLESQKEETKLQEIERKYQEKQQKIREIESNLENERVKLLQHTAAVERFAEIQRQIENNLAKLLERAEGLKREGIRAEKSYSEHLEESQKLEVEIKKTGEKVVKLQAEKRTADEELNRIRLSLQAEEKALNSLRQQYAGVQNRLDTLQELEEKKAIYAPSVQKIFSAQEKLQVKIIGILADKFKVESQAEKAVESLLGNYLQTILVEDKKSAEKILEFVKENKLGKTSVLVVEKLKSKEKVKGLAKILNVSEELAEVLNKAFPIEMSAEIVGNKDNIKDSGVFVSTDGEVFVNGKLFIGGLLNVSEKNTSLLAFKRELRDLTKKSEDLAKEIAEFEKKVEEIKKNLSEKVSQTSEMQMVIQQNERNLFSQEVQAKSLKQELERAERHQKVVSEESKQIEKELSELQERRQKSVKDAEVAEEARIIASDLLTEISRKLMNSREEIEAENLQLSEKRAIAAAFAERRRSITNSLRRLENEQRELDSRIAQSNFEKIEAEGKINHLKQQLKDLKDKIEASEFDQQAEAKELNSATDSLKKAREISDAMSVELAELNQSAAVARNLRAEIEVQQAEAVTRLQNLYENCLQELNLSLIDLVENENVEEGFRLEEARQKIEDLRHQLDNFGAVNMLALEELAESEERLVFLTSQRQDIIDSISSAEEALREIKERSRERFRQAFTSINEYFTELFVELFGGGNGKMNLLEAEDILESGVEIVAQPPGKRLQNILLLSGGEKAMTAIALVMAIFKYRPSPFCLLDEVDAPLDDANVGRFVDKIAQMSENTQFIVITHNKRTMESAKALYGVTMEEAGVSKVVSVRFE